MGGALMSSIVLSGDTSGAVTVNVPSVAGTNTVTIPAVTGTVMVSSNMPAFSVILTASQNVSNNTATKIAFNGKIFDTANAFDATTNYRFQPTVAGYYQFNAVLNSNGTTVTIGSIIVYKNGSSYTRIGYQANTAPASGSCLVYLNGTTDYIELYGLVAATSGAQFYSDGTQFYTSFSGALVRTA
jgi:hypothetical protein